MICGFLPGGKGGERGLSRFFLAFSLIVSPAFKPKPSRPPTICQLFSLPQPQRDEPFEFPLEYSPVGLVGGEEERFDLGELCFGNG